MQAIHATLKFSLKTWYSNIKLSQQTEKSVWKHRPESHETFTSQNNHTAINNLELQTM